MYKMKSMQYECGFIFFLENLFFDWFFNSLYGLRYVVAHTRFGRRFLSSRNMPLIYILGIHVTQCLIQY